MSGSYLGRNLSLKMYNKDGEKVPHTKITLHIMNFGKTFKLETDDRNFFQRLFGKSDPTVGSRAFDAHFFINSFVEEFIKKLFDAELRRLF